ncbi:MAG TPA: YvrJ family protein [Clostridiales bacterium]|nr:YvrJ family protein [Clostridiales bacterium]
MEEMLQGVANFGFPIIVSAYLLIRMENKMENLQKAIVDLSRTIERINQK